MLMMNQTKMVMKTGKRVTMMINKISMFNVLMGEPFDGGGNLFRECFRIVHQMQILNVSPKS